MVLGKRIEEHLRFTVCFWHSFCWPGSDVFDAGTFDRPWLTGPNDAAAARAKRETGLAFVEKLDVPFYCFDDVDVMAEVEDAKSFRSNFAKAVDHPEQLQAQHERKLLWGTANLFSHPRYMAGAATNPDPEVYAWAPLQVRDALDATKCLVVDHKHRIGFTGTILIEPKPHEPTKHKHQYDFDTQSIYAFLKRYGLEKEIKVNIEAKHATLGGHSFEHELAMARALGILGSVDANRGDYQNGWDTDQFPNSMEEWTLAMLEFLRAGGFSTGGFNSDRKVRRQSIDTADLFHGHVGGIDTVAQALLNAAAIIEDGEL